MALRSEAPGAFDVAARHVPRAGEGGGRVLRARLISLVQRLLAAHGLKIARDRNDHWEPQLDLFEVIAARRFADAPPRFAIQIGANDGVTEDPLHGLIRRHAMTALLLEPLPDAHARLVANTAGLPGITVVNAAIADRDGTRPLYHVISPDGRDLSHFASFDHALVVNNARNFLTGAVRVRQLDVPTICPRTLLARHPMERVDILQIDAEGYDAEVVRLFLEAGCRPVIVQFEHCHLGRREDDACRDLLRRHGYALARCGRDTVAVRDWPGPGR